MARLWFIAPSPTASPCARPDFAFRRGLGRTATLLSLLPLVLVLVLALLAATAAASCAAASMASALAGGTAAASISPELADGAAATGLWRNCREPDALRQRRPLRRVIGRDHGIVGRQAPFRAILLRRHPERRQMPSQRFESPAVVEAHPPPHHTAGAGGSMAAGAISPPSASLFKAECRP